MAGRTIRYEVVYFPGGEVRVLRYLGHRYTEARRAYEMVKKGESVR